MMQEHELNVVLASVLRTAVDAIVVIDESGIIQSVNPATERMFGYSVAEMVGNNIKMLMPSPYREQHDQYLQHYRDTGQHRIIGNGREVMGIRKDASTFSLHLAVSEVHTSSQRFFAGIIRDISAMKAVESELQQLNQTLDQRIRQQADELKQTQSELAEKERLAMLGRISGGIAHEIRNPLNAIKTSAYYLLNASQISAEKMDEHLCRIDRQVSIIDAIVTALFDLARLPDPRAISIPIEAMFRSIVAEKTLPNNIEVKYDFPADLPAAKGDEKQLPIVWENLIRNACDAMPNGGTLVLSGRCVEDRIIVKVADSGCGIAPDVLSRIEEPFFSTKPSGMGLGLAITRAILKKNRGEIRVETNRGVGTTFFVNLPIHSRVEQQSDNESY